MRKNKESGFMKTIHIWKQKNSKQSSCFSLAGLKRKESMSYFLRSLWKEGVTWGKEENELGSWIFFFYETKWKEEELPGLEKVSLPMELGDV